MDKQIFVKTPQCEISLDRLCYRQYCKINNLMNMIESTFSVSLEKDYPEIRHEILDISNFIKRLPERISEVM